ncbi:Hypothetical_protein [Hexamita inflata]|uniref:Hypothetical_protein n=1 Tax=Hexamita inflata TaxID=28002 RepID=A0AA86NI43_9EUKA|nr:Hypothetical protein HINF_LOCUS7280 [Hexamita inflata]
MVFINTFGLLNYLKTKTTSFVVFQNMVGFVNGIESINQLKLLIIKQVPFPPTLERMLSSESKKLMFFDISFNQSITVQYTAKLFCYLLVKNNSVLGVYDKILFSLQVAQVFSVKLPVLIIVYNALTTAVVYDYATIPLLAQSLEQV